MKKVAAVSRVSEEHSASPEPSGRGLSSVVVVEDGPDRDATENRSIRVSKSSFRWVSESRVIR
jgi:hypothetical protein